MIKAEFEKLIGKPIKYEDYGRIEKAYMLDAFDTHEEVAIFYQKYGIEPFIHMGKIIDKLPNANPVLKTGGEIIDWLFSEYYSNPSTIRIISSEGEVYDYNNPVSFIQNLKIDIGKLYTVLKRKRVNDSIIVMIQGELNDI